MALNSKLSAEFAVVILSLVLLSFMGKLVPVVEGVWLTIPSTGTKCFSEEIQNHVVVLADYQVLDDGGDQSNHEQHHINSTISAKVTSPYGNNLYHIENVTQGQFAFTTKEAGSYVACFWVDQKHQQAAEVTINLDWRIGIAARDWESVAKKDKIEGVELELRKLEGIVDSIHENLIFLKSRESEMRETSERTNARVAWFSIMSLGICIIVSFLQLWYLKRFFRKKKLI